MRYGRARARRSDGEDGEQDGGQRTDAQSEPPCVGSDVTRLALRRAFWKRRARPYVTLQGVLQPADAKLWVQKWRWYERSSLPWQRARLHYEFARRRAFCRWPVQGNVLEMLLEGRLELGEHVLLEPNVWLTAPAPGRIRIGGGSFLNLGVMVAAVELVEIGAHCMFANGCFVTDGNHRFDDPDKPVTWQGFTSKGPTRVGDNVWCGANVVITSGVTVGDRCVIGANSVVTTDLPPYSIAAGAPARVLRTIEYPLSASPA
jgi:acetyltransferase-like isoleucine patch superfamily enzyme